MTDQVSPLQPPTVSQSTLFTLSEKARSFGLNPDRPFFPVNSLRLLYFMILEETTGNKEAIETMDRLIPKVEAFLSARLNAHVASTNPAEELQVCLPLITDIQAEIDDFQFVTFLHGLFTTTFPLHDALLVSLSERMSQHSETISQSDLNLLLQCRAMDSVIFAEILKHLIQRSSTLGEGATTQLLQALPWILQKVYVLNDMVDCVIFAKDDMGSGAFSPLTFVQLIAPEPQEAKTLITATLEKNMSEKNAFVVPEKVASILELFFHGLNSIIMG